MEPFATDAATLKAIFEEAIEEAIVRYVDSQGDAHVRPYLATLLIEFLHTDRIYSLKSKSGERLQAISDMLQEGDVRLNADSFERERQVHQHIGDFLLFWLGLYPEYLRRSADARLRDLSVDYAQQGAESYFVVSTFYEDGQPDRALTFRRLSDGFEDFAFCLGDVRRRLGLFA